MEKKGDGDFLHLQSFSIVYGCVWKQPICGSRSKKGIFGKIRPVLLCSEFAVVVVSLLSSHINLHTTLVMLYGSKAIHMQIFWSSCNAYV